MLRKLARFVLVVAWAHSGSPGAVQEELTNEEYAVYVAVLTGRLASGSTWRVVQRETTDDASDSPSDFDRTAEHLMQEFLDKESSGPLLEELIRSFRGLRRSNDRIDPKWLDVSGVTVVASKEIDSIFKDRRDVWGGWEELFERFNGSRSIVRLSRVAFSSDGSRAMLAVSRSCGALCGSAEYLLVGRTEGEWLVLASHRTWIS